MALPAITFSGQCHFLALSPFLLAIAQEVGADLAATGQLMAWMALAWGSASVASGPASDRFGRKTILLFGLCLLSISALGSALVTDFAQMSALRCLAGVGGGTMTPSVFATVGDNFPAKDRGRALGWVMAEMSLAQVAGVPLVTFAAKFVGWRWSVVGLAVLTFALVALVVRLLPARRGQTATGGPLPSAIALLRRPGVLFDGRVFHGAVGL